MAAPSAGETGHLADHGEHPVYVDHGATAGTARPTLGSGSNAAVVCFWDGSVEPDNGVTGDYWYDDANDVWKRYDGSSWVSSGAYVPAPGEVVESGDTAAQIQTKADTCETDGTTLIVPDGTWTGIDTTVVLRCAVEASSGATFTGDANPVIQVGDDTGLLARHRIKLPKVERETKVWEGTTPTIGTDVGVLVARATSCEIHVPHVKSFSVGLLLDPDGAHGVAYNRFFLGHLDNNAVNLHVATTFDGGWVTENQFHGARYSHNSGEGSEVAGTAHIKIDYDFSFVPNNLLFFGGSVEGDVAEYHLDCDGWDNQFQGLRWENSGGARVWWQAGAQDNVIIGGYQADEIVYTLGTAAIRNETWRTGEPDRALPVRLAAADLAVSRGSPTESSTGVHRWTLPTGAISGVEGAFHWPKTVAALQAKAYVINSSGTANDAVLVVQVRSADTGEASSTPTASGSSTVAIASGTNIQEITVPLLEISGADPGDWVRACFVRGSTDDLTGGLEVVRLVIEEAT